MSQTTHSSSETDVGAASLTDNEYHRLMSVRRRRTVLAALAELGFPVVVDELAAAVVEREMEPGAPDEPVDQIATELHHVHLPKMDSLGVIDYDHTANRVVTSH